MHLNIKFVSNQTWTLFKQYMNTLFMAFNYFGKLILFILILTTSLAHTSGAKASTEYEEVIKSLREENAILRKEVEILQQQQQQQQQQQRDVEGDIAEIREILKSYGEDITNLRINQVYKLFTACV